MGWFASKVMNWATAQQEKEILDFVQRVSAADSSELGLTVAMATTYRHIVRRGSGIDLIHPALALLADPLICTRLNREIRELQRNKQFADAAPVIIWLHSMRASQDLKLRPHGRELWHQLSRGFPYVREVAENHMIIHGSTIELEGYNQIPDGLGPQT
jgi:hypothetical protein